MVPDVYKACERFESLGVPFVKKPDGGGCDIFSFFLCFCFLSFFSLCECVVSCLCCGLVYQPVYLSRVARAVMYTGRVLELPVLCALVCQPVYQRHVARAVMYSGRVLEMHVLCVHGYDYFSLFISVMLHVL